MNKKLKELGLYFNNEKPLSRTQGLKIVSAIHDYISMLEDRVDNLETSYLRKTKVLEIIRNKNISMECLKKAIRYNGLEWYNKLCFPTERLSQEEYDLISEVLDI